MNERTLGSIESINQQISDAEVFLYATRCSSLQRKALASLCDLRSEIHDLKEDAILDKDEDCANMFLGFECVVGVLEAELEMWLCLKEEEPDKAWECLIRAQRLCVVAARAHDGFSHLPQKHQRLLELEQLVFPPQVFMSSGLIIGRPDCSICGQKYEDCTHLRGMPYMGQFCRLVIREPELNHVAIVEQPADKSCRVTEFDVEGGTRNRMTWRISPKCTDSAEQSEGQVRGRAILLSTTEST